MLSILLTILKIIGIILLVLIGIVVLFLLLLCVPIRYRANGHKEEDISLSAVVSWLCHFIHATIGYDGDEKKVTVRVFGFLVYPKKEKEPKARKSKNKKSKNKKAKKKKAKKTKTENIKEKRAEADRPQNEPEVQTTEALAVTEQILPVEVPKIDESPEPSVVQITDEEERDELDELIDSYDFDDTPTSKKELRKRRRQEKKENKKNKKNRNTKSLSDRYNSFVDKLKRIYNKYTEVMNIIDDPKVRHTASVLKKKLGQVLRHLLPRKVRGYVEFGFDDPATTGYLTALLGALYGTYGKSISISPDFENKKFACRGKMRGHIRLMTYILLLLNVLLRPDCRYTYHLIKNFLGEDNVN